MYNEFIFAFTFQMVSLHNPSNARNQRTSPTVGTSNPKNPTLQGLQILNLSYEEREFLMHAPQEAIRFFVTMSPEEKEIVMQRFKYNPTSIDILDTQGKLVHTLQKENFIPPEDLLIKGLYLGHIHIDEQAGTCFNFHALESAYLYPDIQLVPTQEQCVSLLRVMPAADGGIFKYNRSALQLYSLLGGKFWEEGVRGYFRLRSESNQDKGFCLTAWNKSEGIGNGSYGVLGHMEKHMFFPVRLLIK